jgi:hypothetical protein
MFSFYTSAKFRILLLVYRHKDNLSYNRRCVCVGGHPFLHLLVDKISSALDEPHVLFYPFSIW